MVNMNPLRGCLLALVVAGPFASGQTPVDAALERVSEWVETERRISRDRESWQSERASIESLTEVFRSELVTLQEQIANSEADTSAAEQQRAELLEEDRILREMEGRVMEQLIGAEISLRALYNKLPPPLQQELRPLAVVLPEDPRTSTLSLGQRIQPVAAMLTQIQRFNASVTVIDDFREFQAGSPVQVKTIYFGLGAAYYVDGANVHAGVGVPGPDGWVWQENANIALQVRDFLDIYGGNRQAEYVFLPVRVQD